MPNNSTSRKTRSGGSSHKRSLVSRKTQRLFRALSSKRGGKGARKGVSSFHGPDISGGIAKKNNLLRSGTTTSRNARKQLGGKVVMPAKTSIMPSTTGRKVMHGGSASSSFFSGFHGGAGETDDSGMSDRIATLEDKIDEIYNWLGSAPKRKSESFMEEPVDDAPEKMDDEMQIDTEKSEDSGESELGTSSSSNLGSNSLWGNSNGVTPNPSSEPEPISEEDSANSDEFGDSDFGNSEPEKKETEITPDKSSKPVDFEDDGMKVVDFEDDGGETDNEND